MGSVANKIAKKVKSSGKSKVFSLAGFREGRKLALEAGFGDDVPTLSKRFADYDPCHAIYIFGQNFASIMGELIADLREAKDFTRIVGDAEDEYMPDYPPISPLSTSYFTMWSMFDVRFGSSGETIGTCILRIVPEFDGLDWVTDVIGPMQQSRMGFYVHCGIKDGAVLLREVGTREIISCLSPAGYLGRKGQIWFVRLLPPPNRQCHQHIVFNTPYVIRDYPERAFTDYLKREFARMKEWKKSPGTEGARRHLMKYGPDPNHWNEYIFCAYSSHQYDAIFLTGIPDIPNSLPHA